MHVWIGGRRVEPGEDATAVPASGAAGRRPGVFETLKVIDGVPFALTRHLDRMGASAQRLGLPRVDTDLVRAAVREALAAEPVRSLARLRLLWGDSVDGGAALSSLVVEVTALAAPAATVDVVTAPWPRTDGGHLAGHKSAAYAENLLALADAVGRGAGEAVFADRRGRLSEGTGSNVFVVLDGELRTPTAATGLLPGITRGLVLEWCGARECDVPLEKARLADEVFVVSSTRDVQAVARWDDRTWLEVGPVTREVARVFAERASADVDP